MSIPLSFHVIYSNSAAHPTITTVALLGASICILLWFNRRQRRRARQHLRFAKLLPDQLTEPSVTIRTGTAANPAPKKRITAQEKKEAKTKKRIAKKEADAEAAAMIKTPLVSSAIIPTLAKRSHETAAPTLRTGPSYTTITQRHVHPAPASHAASRPDNKPLPAVQRDVGDQQRAPASPSRSVSPSPSESTTATTAATMQSSTLVLTPPSSVLPSIPLPAESDTSESLLEDLNTPCEEEDRTISVSAKSVDKGKQRQESDWIGPDAVDVPSNTTSAPIETPVRKITIPPNRINLPILIPPPVEPANDRDKQRRSPPSPNSAEKTEKRDGISRHHSRSNSITTQSTTAATVSSTRSRTSASSGGVGLGLPSSSLRPSPTASPSRLHPALPPRHRLRQQEQPGQPPLSPHGFGGFPFSSGPPTPGLRSPTPSSPLAFAGSSTPWAPGTPPLNHTMAYPRAMHPPHPMLTPPIHGYPYPHSLGVPSPAGHVIPMFSFDSQPPTPHGNPQFSADAMQQGNLGTDNSYGAPTDGLSPRNEDESDESEEEAQEVQEGGSPSEDSHLVVDFPTLNPAPSKTARGRRKIRSKGGAMDVNANASHDPATAPVEVPIPQDRFAPAYPMYPPPHPGPSSSPSPFFHPYPYPPHHALPPRIDSRNGSPAWPTTMVLGQEMNEGTLLTHGGGGEGTQQHLGVEIYPRAQSRCSESTGSTSSYSISAKAGTITPNSTPSTHPSPRVPVGHLHPQPMSYSPLQPPSAPFMRAASTPSPIPMPPGWYGPSPINSPGGGYFIPAYPAWGYPNLSSNGGGDAGLLSPPRSASPFVHQGGGGQPIPTPVQVPYAAQFYPPYGYPSPHGQFPPHPLAMSSLPPAPGSAPGVGHRSGFPVLPPIRPRSSSRRGTIPELPMSPLHDNDDDDGNDVSEQLMSAILKNPESMKASSSVSSGRSSRAGSRSLSGTGSEKGGSISSSCGSP